MTQVCSWCSAAVTEGVTDCPSCGANLVPDGEPNVPGVTAIDAVSLLRSKSAPKPRGRLLNWISGEVSDDIPSKAEAGALALPALEVRREIFRLELEAEVANLQAEADALWAEAAAEGRSIEGLGGPVTVPAEPAVESAAAADGEVATESQPDEGASADAAPAPSEDPAKT
jgi:hypothetical protein